MSSLFDDEVLNIVLKFSNPNQRVMEDANKHAAQLSQSLDSVIRKAVSTGKSIATIAEALGKLGPSLDKFKDRTRPLEPATVSIGMAQRMLARYTPGRLERISEVQSLRSVGTESSGSASLRKALEDNTKALQQANTSKLPSSREQLILESVRNLSEEMKSTLQQRLGDFNRGGWARPAIKQRTILSNYASTAADGVGEIFSKYVIEAMEGGITARTRRPVSSSTYGMRAGSGQSPEVTPGYIGAAAIGLERRIRVIEEFQRNLAIAGKLNEEANFLKTYSAQATFQEKNQRSMGRGIQNKMLLRAGDELAIATMSGVNTAFRTKRDIDSGFYDPNQHSRPSKNSQDLSVVRYREAVMNRMLTQPWAQPSTTFGSSEVDAFIKQHQGNPAVGSIKTAAQMAASIGSKDHRFSALADILLAGQGVGRQLRNQRLAEDSRRVATGDSPAFSSKRPGRKLTDSLRGLADFGASLNSALNDSAKGGTLGFGFGDLFENAFNKFRERRKKRSAASSSQAQVEQEPEYDLKASMRFDALHSKLSRLAETVEATTKSFERYRDVTAPSRRETARTSFENGDLAITQRLTSTNTSLDAQLARVENRRNRSRQAASASILSVNAAADSKQASLGFAALELEIAHEEAVTTQKRRLDKLMNSQAGRAGKIPQEAIDALSFPVNRANRRLTLANYHFESAQIDDPEELDALRKKTASSLATQRYGKSAAFSKERNEHADRVYELMSGPSLGQQVKDKSLQLNAAQLQREKEFDQEKEQIALKREAAQHRADNSRQANASKLGLTLVRVEEDVAKKGEQAAQTHASANRKASEARVAYVKKEQIIANGSGGGGRGGSAPGGGGGSGGAAGDFASRGALGWGLGAAGLAAYGSILKEVIKDTVIYAARTETLQLVTNQMARVNGLNVDQVDAQVERMKQLNITTQEAHTTVQKMVFAQLDVAKATNLARTAQDAAILANVNSSEALDKIILGIVTGQTRVLHNMNLQVSMLQVLKELRTSKRATGDKSEPTELEKRQAMLNKVLLEGAKIMGTYERAMLTAGKQFNSLQREIQETQNAVGEEFLPEFGRAVSLMSSGLRVMRENSSETAKFASGLVSLGAAASAIGSLSFFKWMMSSPAIPPWAKTIGAVVGVTSYAVMNRDNAEAMSTTATEQLNSVQSNIAKLRKERARLFGASDKDDPDWKNTWAQNTAALESLSNQQVAIQKDLTGKLADEYNKRLADLEDYGASLEGKKGYFKRVMADMFGSPEASWTEKVLNYTGIGGILGLNKGDKEERDRLTVSTIPGISQEDIKKEAGLRKANKERLTLMPPTMLNKERIEIKGIIAEMQQAEGELVKLDDRLSETGSVGLKSRKAMGSPREKVTLDYEHQVAQVNKLTASLNNLTKKSAEGDITAKSKLAEVAKDLGGGSFEVGEKKINDFMARREDIIASAAEDRDIQLSKISRSNAAQIAQIREQTTLSGVKAKAVVGNYESETAAIQKTFEVRQDTNKRVLSLTGDIDAHKKKIAQDETERELALMELEERRAKARLNRSEDVARATGSFNAGRILDSPIDARDAVIKAYGEEFKATKAISDEEKRRDERLRLVLKLREDLVKVAQDELRLNAEAATAKFESQQEVATEIDRITSSKGRTNAQRNLDEIERARVRALATAENRYSNFVGVTPSAGQGALRQERDTAKMKAEANATVSIIKELDQQVEAAHGRLGDYYRQQFQRVERINELEATNLTDESNAAFNTHLQRLSYIKKEYEAKGKTIQAEKEKSQEIQEAEFDQLQKLLAIRKKEIEGIKAAAGSVFDAITRGDGGGIKELAMGQLRVTGRQIFQNIAGETFGSARQVIGNIIPGQNTTDSNGKRHSTMIGRILSGTLLSPSNAEDTNKLLAKVTLDSTTAEKELAMAVASLDAAVRAATGQGAAGLSGMLGGSGISGSTRSALGGFGSLIPGGSSMNSVLGALGGTGLFGGANSSNPLIFHGLPSSGTAAMNKDQVLGDWGEDTPTFSTDVIAGKKPSRYNQFMGGLGLGATGKANIFDVFSGASSVRTGQGSVTGMTGAQRVGAAAGYAALIGGGAMTAISGFKEGGLGGTVKGIGGVLTAASAIPGPQQPFIMAGAMAAGLIASLLPNARETRKKEIEQWTKDNKHIEPIAIDIEMTAEGNLVSYNKFGKSRDSRNAAFPITIQQNQHRPSMADDNEEVFLPGRVVDPPQRPAAGGNIYINMPVSAIDSRDFMSRSRDIVQAVQKEIRLSSDLGLGLQNSIFGAS